MKKQLICTVLASAAIASTAFAAVPQPTKTVPVSVTVQVTNASDANLLIANDHNSTQLGVKAHSQNAATFSFTNIKPGAQNPSSRVGWRVGDLTGQMVVNPTNYNQNGQVNIDFNSFGGAVGVSCPSGDSAVLISGIWNGNSLSNVHCSGLTPL